MASREFEINQGDYELWLRRVFMYPLEIKSIKTKSKFSKALIG